MPTADGPETCPSFEGCAAPLCPLDSPSLRAGQWFAGEAVCSARRFGGLPWLRTQRRLAPLLKGRDVGCFTVKMLAAIKNLSPAITGVDPDKLPNGEIAWLRSRRRGQVLPGDQLRLAFSDMGQGVEGLEPCPTTPQGERVQCP